MLFGTIGSSALDLLYPKSLYCICCGKMIDETRTYRLCGECMRAMKWAGGRICEKCGRPLSDINPSERCFVCRQHPHNFDRGFSCAAYSSCEREIIFSLKYYGHADVAETIAEIMYDRMTAEFSPDELFAMYDMLLPVPVHRHKLNIRGFNQAGIIADAFAALSGIRAEPDLLIRTRETRMMRSLSPEERRENIRGAFEIRPRRKPDIAGRSLLIIDDIYTTGATIDEIARVLKAAGAAKVDFLTFAAGADMLKT